MAEQIFVVPMTNVPQKFGVTLSGRQLDITSKWNEHAGWVADVADSVTDTPLITGIPLVVGADLLAQYEYVGIPGSLIVYTDGAQFTDPTEDNLGIESNLYYVVDV